MEFEVPMQRETNYEKFPIFTVSPYGSESWEGWPRILKRLDRPKLSCWYRVC